LKTYVINLARCKERRRHITRQLELCGLAWELVEGVDARKAGDAILGPRYVTAEFKAAASGPPTAERGSLRPGAVTCALAHKLAFERLIAEGGSWSLVLEDDVELPRDVGRLAEDIGAQTCPHRAEVVLLNFHKPGGLELRRTGAVALVGGRLLASPVDLTNLTSGAAYILTSEAAKRLASSAFPMKAFSDEWGSFVQQGVLEQVRVVAPMPVRQSPAFRTTIDYYAPMSFSWCTRELAYYLKVDRLPGLRSLWVRRRLKDMQRWGALGSFRVLP
jgi:GR25 family glycosyltransferase involved in LPS biosynthesis